MIRNLEPGDLEAALTVWQTANQQVHRFLPAAFWRRRRGRFWQPWAGKTVYVAVEQGKVVGFIGLHRDWVQGLFLLPNGRDGASGSNCWAGSNSSVPSFGFRCTTKTGRPWNSICGKDFRFPGAAWTRTATKCG